jgi:hypothetical protein
MAFYHGEKIFARKLGTDAGENSVKPGVGGENLVSRTLEVVYAGGGLRLTLKDGDGQVLGESCRAVFPSDHTEGKNCLKTALYDLLCEAAGRTLPWGTLTGIRPTKLPMAFYDSGRRVCSLPSLKRSYTVTPKSVRPIRYPKRKSVSVPRWRPMRNASWKVWIRRGLLVCISAFLFVRPSVCTALFHRIP